MSPDQLAREVDRWAKLKMDDFRPAPLKPIVSVADLEKLDVRVGTIVAVEDVPESAKLLRLRLVVDFGDHRRTILAGMKAERAKGRGREEVPRKRTANG